MTRPWLGAIEGYYGPPYSHAARCDLVRWLGTQGATDFVYAPKGDPLQRDRWREPYPAAQLAEFAELVEIGRAVGVDVGFVVSPGLDWSPGDEVPLVAKLTAFRDLGARVLGVAFDDVPPGGADLGAVHGAAVAAAVSAVGGGVRWAACPTDYAAAHATGYLRAFVAALPDSVDVMWTGPAIVSPDITAADARSFAADLGLGRRLVLADNVPVNDGAMAGVLHLGPYPRTDAELPAATGGLLLNAMALPLASRVGIGAAVRWWREPTRSPDDVWREVLAELPGLLPLATAARSWLTAPGPDPQLAEWADKALTTDDDSLLHWLGAGCRAGLPAEWAAELAPWLTAYEWEAFVMSIAVSAVRGGLGPPAAAAFYVAEAWRRIRALGEQQLFGIRYALYPVTRRVGDAELPDLAGLVEGDNLTDQMCRRALSLLTKEPT